jgi:lysophospholipase
MCAGLTGCATRSQKNLSDLLSRKFKDAPLSITATEKEQVRKSWNNIMTVPKNWNGDRYFTNPETKDTVRYARASAEGKSKGTVILTGGYNEFVEMYYELIKDYQAMGLDVWAMDWHGFGKSGRDSTKDPRRASNRGMDRHVSDLHYFIHDVIRPSDNKPLIFSSNSMGGQVGMLYLQKYNDVFDTAIMSTPMISPTAQNLPRSAVRVVFNLASLVLQDTKAPYDTTPRNYSKWKDGSQGLNDPLLSLHTLRVKANNNIIRRNEDLILDAPTFNWIAEAYNSGAQILKKDRLRNVKTRLLIGIAEHDALVDNRAIRKAVKGLPYGATLMPEDTWHSLWFQSQENRDLWMAHVRAIVKEAIEKKTPEESKFIGRTFGAHNDNTPSDDEMFAHPVRLAQMSSSLVRPPSYTLSL